MRLAAVAVVAGLALAAACASASDAGEASNDAVAPGQAGSSSGGATSTGGSGGAGGALPDAGTFPDSGPQGGASGSGAAGNAGAGNAGAGNAGAGNAGAGNAGAGNAGAGNAGAGNAGAGNAGAGNGGSSAGGAGASGASAGSAGASCTPQCAGKQCGADGCNGSCGSCGSQQTCSAGQCQDVCLPSWKVPLTGVTPGRVIVDAGVLYAVGARSGQGYLGAFDACTGKETASYLTPAGSPARLTGVQLSATHVFATGERAQEGLVVRAKRGSLALDSSDPLFGSTGSDEVWDGAPTPAGHLWMTGVSSVETAPSFWTIVGPVSGSACGFPLFPAELGLGRAVVTGGGKVFVVGQRAPNGVVARFADQNCMLNDPCVCPPEQSVTLQMGPVSTEVRHAAYANGKLFVVGYGSDGTNSVSFLSRLDPTDLSTEATYKLDSSPVADAFLAVSVDAGIVYAGGMKGWQGGTSYQTATAQVIAIPAAFGPGTSPLWVHEPALGHVVWGLSAQGGSVYVSLSESDGALMKCAVAGCQ